jgi:hypothetical protein
MPSAAALVRPTELWSSGWCSRVRISVLVRISATVKQRTQMTQVSQRAHRSGFFCEICAGALWALRNLRSPLALAMISTLRNLRQLVGPLISVDQPRAARARA